MTGTMRGARRDLHPSRYGLLKNGRLSFPTGQGSPKVCGDGYCKVINGNYDLVYGRDEIGFCG